jgi:hypothetical protein
VQKVERRDPETGDLELRVWPALVIRVENGKVVFIEGYPDRQGVHGPGSRTGIAAAAPLNRGGGLIGRREDAMVHDEPVTQFENGTDVQGIEELAGLDLAIGHFERGEKAIRCPSLE